MIHGKSSSSSSILLAAVFVLFASSTIHPTAALSWPLCENGGTVWVTERPRTEPQFPGANLWFFCEGSLNVLGNSISACVPGPDNDTICLPQVAEAVCQLLGYEKSFPGDTIIVPALPEEPVVTLTGDFCLRKGVFAKEIPENLASMPGEPCDKIHKLTCIRTLDTMAAAASLGLGEPLNVLQASPAAEDLASTAQLAEQQAVERQDGSTTVGDATDNSGRKMLKRA
ncbi:hypothetical protein Ndes2526B_g06892 [Nannochloris sp. 'desiccata']|nr:hypothetical protein KSW81_005009 [Chlorella desiccata (nom. nud.)]KAH7617999.1 hypothetical protein NADE_000200 [Chlorella desiccata (nom. nud.)]